MATALSRAPVERVRRVHLFAYLLVLMGLTFGSDHVETLLVEGVTLAAAAGLVMSASMLLAAAVVYRNPGNLRRGTDPAPVYLWALAAVATAAFAVVVGIQTGAF